MNWRKIELMKEIRMTKFERNMLLFLLIIYILLCFVCCFKISEYRSTIEKQEATITKLEKENLVLEKEKTKVLVEILKELQ